AGDEVAAGEGGQEHAERVEAEAEGLADGGPGDAEQALGQAEADEAERCQHERGAFRIGRSPFRLRGCWRRFGFRVRRQGCHRETGSHTGAKTFTEEHVWTHGACRSWRCRSWKGGPRDSQRGTYVRIAVHFPIAYHPYPERWRETAL